MKSQRALFLILSLFCLWNLSLFAGTDPDIILTFKLDSGGTKGATVDTSLEILINDVSVGSYSWKSDQDCINTKVLSKLANNADNLANYQLRTMIAEETLALENLPWAKLASSFTAFELYMDGELLTSERFAGEEPPVAIMPEATSSGDCMQHVDSDYSCTEWAVSNTSSETTDVPCIMGFDECDEPIWGTKTCTSTITTYSRTCTHTVTISWTPLVPGAICPGTTTMTSTYPQSRSTTVTDCGNCGS